MNSLASVGTSPNGLLAAFGAPAITANTTPQSPAFVNMISLFLSSSKQQSFQGTSTDEAQVITASPGKIADSMIRSMLNNLSSGSTNASSSMSQALSLKGSSLPALNTVLDTPSDTTPDLKSDPTLNTPAPLADSVIQSIFVNAAKPLSDVPVAAGAPETRKLRSIAELPTISTMIAPAPTANLPVPSTPAPATAGGPTVNVTSAPQVAAPAASSVPLTKSEIAFTAVLTPVKETSAPVIVSNAESTVSAAPRQIVVSPAAAILPATTVSTSPQPLSVQGSPDQTKSQPVEKDSNGNHPDANSQQNRDNSSQQDDSARSTSRAAAPSDTKVKPANFKQDDNGTTVVQDHTAGLISGPSLTAFPDQGRAAAAESGPAAAAPPQTPSTAEALRTAESNLPEAAPLRAGTAQEISIRIAQPDAAPLDLRISERAGQVHVDVRTADGALQTSLRQDLGTLTSSLEKAGYHSETFVPAALSSRAASTSQTGNQDGQQDSSKKQGGFGDSAGERRQQQQQQKRPSAWLEELEEQ